MARRPPGAADAPQGRPEPEAVVPLTADDDAERLAAGLQTTVGDALNRLCDLARDIQGDAPQKLV
ncbi:MAG TPA: hypothetical protein VI854_04900, partial [Acidimicrobiia bacterium]|nr:hypothetical protein [Acidimicrobiia bacterium]